jgi:hypothetical protein
MSNQSNRPIQSLEFDEIKENLKDYLRSQSTFKDYDFEGSALSIIMDLMAYNTHYQAYYANMVANESFLDSAVIRESVVSLAKHLNYTPRSIKASRITIDAVLTSSVGDDLDVFTQEVVQGKQFIERGTVFRGKDIDGKSVSFVTLDSYKAVRRNGENIVKDIVLYQGSLKQISYVANTQDESIPTFIIPDKNIDIDTLVVVVQKSQTDSTGTNEVWNRITDINKTNSTTTGFFVQENKEGLWEIYFGDGIVGRAIENGNVIFMRYLVTNGAAGNGIGFDESAAKRSITCSDGRVREVRIKTDSQGRVLVSNSGRDAEDTESIRFYAPRNYQAQDRAVTADDYKALLGREYSNRADSFYIWGGEENDPPQYGKVFISIKPKVGNRLSLSEKQAIERTILGERNLVTIVPEVVDPDILYIIPNITVYYDESKTSLSREGIQARMIAMVKFFNSEYLGLFQRNFRQSKFSSMIDGSSPAINSNTTQISLMKEFEPNLGRPAPYTINFDNPLLHPVDGYTPIMSSTVFGYVDSTSNAKIKPTVDAFLDDDGYGNIRIFKQIGSKKIIINKKIGTIDYVKGTVSLRNFAPEYLGTGQTALRLTVTPENRDIFSRRNQIITIDELSINITAVPEKTVIDRNASDSSLSR